ncbi:MAG: porin [Alphaproteobacteria bacterium]|nr:porin [Alphaproteobacteria bacterium]
MISIRHHFAGRMRFATAVSALALLSLTSAGANADQHEKIDTLQLKVNKLQQELQQLKEQVAESEAEAPVDDRVLGPREMQSGMDQVRLTLSGQVNRGILVTDDGDDTDVFFVDNDNSSTRIRLLGDARFNDDVSVGSVIEVQLESNSTADVSQDDQRNVGANNFTERKLEVFADSKTYGRLWLGQGDTASNGTSEVDLSGTGVIGYSGIADLAGGIQFQEDGALSGVTIGDTFSNLDGLSRDDRLRYDTPVYSGAKLSASAIADDRWDIALRYARELFGAHEFETAIAYADVDDDFDQVSASASLLLGDTLPGASITLATGNRDFDAGGRNDAQFFYGKLGYQFAPFGIGDTAVAVDYYDGEDIAVDGDESTSIGLVAVQNVDRIGTELYAGLRNYELDRGGADFDDVTGLLVGARLKF